MPRRDRLADARLYFVVDLRPHVVAIVEGALAGGADVVQLREKEASDDEIVAAGRCLRAICARRGALFVVNDRPELALACEADGVHVGQEDVAVAEARVVVGPDHLIGLSTHSRAQIEAAGGADYISVGPVWETPTKLGRPGVGLDLVRFAAERAGVPFFAIGGINAANCAEVAAAGARRIAVVRAIADAPDPEAAARALRKAITRA